MQFLSCHISSLPQKTKRLTLTHYCILMCNSCSLFFLFLLRFLLSRWFFFSLICLPVNKITRSWSINTFWYIFGLMWIFFNLRQPSVNVQIFVFILGMGSMPFFWTPQQLFGNRRASSQHQVRFLFLYAGLKGLPCRSKTQILTMSFHFPLLRVYVGE